jgi:plasmid stability protein
MRCHNGSVNVTIKNLPDDVAQGLKKAAADHGRSLNAHILRILAEAERQHRRRSEMRQAITELDELVKTLPPLPPVEELLDEARRERDS